MQEFANRYSAVSIALHWALAALVVTNVWLGGRMEDAEGAARVDLLSAHASVGISVLVLTLIRIAWRLTHKWPPLPGGTPGWQRVVARITHAGFYVLLIAIPLFGWAAVSAAPAIARLEVFGGVAWPLLPVGSDADLSGLLGETHKVLVKAAYVLIVLHVLGALKHHFLQRDQVLHRMLPLVPAPKRKA